jgi:hypothetical protein
MKEELIVGAWYKSKHNNYFKFEKTENDWNYYSERIIDNIWKGSGGVFFRGVFVGGGLARLENLTEIQSFLPPNHPDLFINKPIQNENLDYLIDLLTSNNIT